MREKLITREEFERCFEEVILKMYVEYSDQPFFDTAFSHIIIELLKENLISTDNLKFYSKKD